MTGYEFCGTYWWIFPLVMIFLCFMFMRRGCSSWMCGCGDNSPGESPLGILNKRYANGDIDQEEYEEKKKILNQTKRTA
jgi:uncharacterized membrane protein